MLPPPPGHLEGFEGGKLRRTESIRGAQSPEGLPGQVSLSTQWTECSCLSRFFCFLFSHFLPFLRRLLSLPSLGSAGHLLGLSKAQELSLRNKKGKSPPSNHCIFHGVYQSSCQKVFHGAELLPRSGVLLLPNLLKWVTRFLSHPYSISFLPSPTDIFPGTPIMAPNPHTASASQLML